MEPGIIKKLEKDVVNRIAAGEIIQRPASALKELLENSLDAKATLIQISIRSGGLKFQIQDNGTGIRYTDLEIICERFTTSKLSKYEDLGSIDTYGFRGEALASISYVAHLLIQTKTVENKCGYIAVYENGKLKEKPKPCASNQGTLIKVSDLFYNMPQRRQSLKSPSEEYQKICEVVFKYAVHNTDVMFHLRRDSDPPTVKTIANSSQLQTIRLIYGNQIANNLVSIEEKDYKLGNLKIKGFITNVNYSAKKLLFILFINHRAVQSTVLKSAIESVYASYLPKGGHPFIYMELEMDPLIIDVNVHPTKHEVNFFYETEITDFIKNELEIRLLASNSTRLLYKQLKLPGASENINFSGKSSEKGKIYGKNLIRTDAKEQKLEIFLSDYNRHSLQKSKKCKEVRLKSVLSMREQIEKNCSIEIRATIKDSVFVGIVDKQFSLFQFGKNLCMWDTLKFSEELFYQRLVYGFQNFSVIKIQPEISVRKLISIALDNIKNEWGKKDDHRNNFIEKAVLILKRKAPIMREYFGVHINKNGNLDTLPLILSNHSPCLTFLPNYILRLSTEVSWNIEEECFENFCRETAHFYAQVSDLEYQDSPKKYKFLVEHTIFPAFKRYILPPSYLKSCLCLLVNVPKLYNVFERC